MCPLIKTIKCLMCDDTVIVKSVKRKFCSDRCKMAYFRMLESKSKDKPTEKSYKKALTSNAVKKLDEVINTPKPVEKPIEEKEEPKKEQANVVKNKPVPPNLDKAALIRFFKEQIASNR